MKPPATVGCVTPVSGKARKSAKVSRVRLQGVKGGIWSDLHKRLKTRAGQTYSVFRMRQDVRRMWRLGVVRNAWVEACKEPEGVAVTFHVQPTRRVRRIRIQLKHPSRPRWHQGQLDRLWRQRKGQRLHRVALKRDLGRLRDLYRGRGYWSAKVIPYLAEVSPTQVDLVIRIHTGHRAVLGQIRFTGNRAVRSEVLRKLMATQDSGVYREEVLQKDMLRIQHHYYNRGYINIKLSTPRVGLAPDSRHLNITFAVTEGRVFRLGKIDLRGVLQKQLLQGKTVQLKDPKAPGFQRLRKKLLQLLRSRTGQIFNRARLARDIERLKAWYYSRGHPYVTVVPITNVDVDRRIIDVELELTCDTRATVERIDVRGHRNVHELLIRSLFGMRRGQLYSAKQIVLGQRRLLALGLFRRVDITWRRANVANRVRLIVDVVELKKK